MPTDFAAILTELNDWGLNDYKIADEVGLDRTMIMRLRKGERDQPKYDYGVIIMEIHKRESKKQAKKPT